VTRIALAVGELRPLEEIYVHSVVGRVCQNIDSAVKDTRHDSKAEGLVGAQGKPNCLFEQLTNIKVSRPLCSRWCNVMDDLVHPRDRRHLEPEFIRLRHGNEDSIRAAI